ncbi:MAG: insulinase family protein [Spirochaetaceae bacterium]|jgi:Zn-dependent M16 (insulinase) family peptidase|nr:insulinase family protein [Spirochaetaceae bacterium]
MHLNKGQILDSGFEIIDTVALDELKAVGIWARHQKTGLEVFHLYNDDSENLFAYAFATTPEDSTGAAHIVEHSVLCGSEQYPLKDTFLILGQGSLQTYLNAWTYPDKTVYPSSSTNEADYFNIMAVYGDAVFRPLLSEWTFMQEGHRLEYNNGKLSHTGVVYNEMKGAYSSFDTFVAEAAFYSVVPDTPYAFESGGDPEHIVDLTWEAFKLFHQSRYAPANCRVFLAGNIPTEKQLCFLSERVLQTVPAGRQAAPIPLQTPWTKTRTVQVSAPASAEQKSSVLLSWLVGDAVNPLEAFSFDVLVEILLGHDGSPLMRPLIESGLGEDISPVSGVESELRQLIFTVGLKGVAGEAEPVEHLILGELRRLVDEGIAPKEIEAALLSLEFSNREIKRAGSGPYALVWLRRSLRGWLHGRKPWDTLVFTPVLNELKERLAADKRYFENLIKARLLDSMHRALIIVKPDTGYLERKEAQEAARMKEIEASWTEAQKRALVEKGAALEAFQSAKDSPEVLARIPHLKRTDLSPELEQIPRSFHDLAGIPVLSCNMWTNGISYMDFAFPVDTLDADDYPWLSIFAHAATASGFAGVDYGEVASLFAQTVGDFSAMLHSGSCVPGMAHTLAFPSGIIDIAGRDWIIFRLKALDEKIEASAELALRSIVEADFSDLRHLRDLVIEMKSDAASGFAYMGSVYARMRSSMAFSRSTKVEELWKGISQIEFIHRVASMEIEEISSRLRRIRDRIVSSSGMLAAITGSDAALTAMFKALEGFARFGAPRPRNPALSFNAPPAPEVFCSPSLQVGFAASSLPAVPYASQEQAAEMVIAHYLSTGALWEAIRMKGGAYGAFALSDSLEGAFSFITYRDPLPSRSLDSFVEVMHSMPVLDGDDLEKAIIGTYSQETRPHTAAEKAFAELLRLLCGIEHHHRARRLSHILSLDAQALSAAANRIGSYKGPLFPVIIAGQSQALQASEKLGVPVKTLPV